MALQDLTPQLRTRLSRVERAVGFFVTIATILLLGGFGYYVYHTAERKGWFLTKVPYLTSIDNGGGLKPGDPVKFVGFTVGEITRIEANEPGAQYGVTIYFRITDPYFGYIWTDSKVRVAGADFLGNRQIEIVKGHSGIPTVLMQAKHVEGTLIRQKWKDEYKRRLAVIQAGRPEATEVEKQEALDETKKFVTQNPKDFYGPMVKTRPFWVEPIDSIAITERLDQVASMVEKALPGIFALTNQLTATLNNVTSLTAQANATVIGLNPAIANLGTITTNLVVITASLKDPSGSLGRWLLTSNTVDQVATTVQSAQTTIDRTDTNLNQALIELTQTLVNLADTTSNLNMQVQANSNFVGTISTAISHTDDLVQGLKRHWLLRSAFKTNAPVQPKPSSSTPVSRGKR